MKIPAVLMRGGTSRGLYFHAADLPVDPAERDRVLLEAFGSPDPFTAQVDGVGGGSSITSKVAVVARSTHPDADVDYTFAQVGVDRAVVAWSGNCGNIASGVAPFALDEGLVTATGSVARIRIHCVNVGQMVTAEIAVRDGRFDAEGEFSIAGVPGTGSVVALRFHDPAGTATGRLLPTGLTCDTVELNSCPIQVSIVDAGNPVVFVRFADFGLRGDEPLSRLASDKTLLRDLDHVRRQGAMLAGIYGPDEAVSSAIPKVALVGAPIDYSQEGVGSLVTRDSHDIRATMITMGRPHRAYAITGGIATAAAAALPGTVVAEVASGSSESVRIGHPSGTLPVDVHSDGASGVVTAATLYRTARRLMEGQVVVRGMSAR